MLLIAFLIYFFWRKRSDSWVDNKGQKEQLKPFGDNKVVQPVTATLGDEKKDKSLIEEEEVSEKYSRKSSLNSKRKASRKNSKQIIDKKEEPKQNDSEYSKTSKKEKKTAKEEKNEPVENDDEVNSVENDDEVNPVEFDENAGGDFFN